MSSTIKASLHLVTDNSDRINYRHHPWNRLALRLISFQVSNYMSTCKSPGMKINPQNQSRRSLNWWVYLGLFWCPLGKPRLGHSIKRTSKRSLFGDEPCGMSRLNGGAVRTKVVPMAARLPKSLRFQTVSLLRMDRWVSNLCKGSYKFSNKYRNLSWFPSGMAFDPHPCEEQWLSCVIFKNFQATDGRSVTIIQG